MQPHSRDPRYEPVERRAAEYLEYAPGARPTPSHGDVRALEGSHELADILGVDLMIGRQSQDQLAAAALEARHDGRGLAEGAIQDHHDDVAGAGVDERLQPLDDIAVRPVHHKHELVRSTQEIQSPAVFLIQLADVLVPGADGYDHGEPDACVAFNH